MQSYLNLWKIARLNNIVAVDVDFRFRRTWISAVAFEALGVSAPTSDILKRRREADLLAFHRAVR